MRIFFSLLFVISLAGCTTQTPEVTEMPSSQIQQAPEAEENSDMAENEVEAMPEETQEASQTEQAQDIEETQTPSAKPSAKPSASASETEAAELEESPEPTPTPTKTQSGYTLADVAKNNSQTSCWVAIDGMVYDLTNWIRSHPGGRAAILSLCGTDGTSGFLGAHGGEARPSATLDGYLLGPLSN